MERIDARIIAAGAVMVAAVVAVAAAAIFASGSDGRAQEDANTTTSGVVWFQDRNNPPGAEVPGASTTLERTAEGINMTFDTSGLEPRHAYTVWWVIFNHPDACGAGGCGVPDLEAALMSGENPAGISVMHAVGHLLGPSGTLHLGAHLPVRDTLGRCVTAPPFEDLCVPLLDAFAAEVHLVLHDHGPRIPGLLDEQIGSFEGGCGSYVVPGAGDDGADLVVVEYSPHSDYACFSPQASAHLP
jgi:hypothetical protein